MESSLAGPKRPQDRVPLSRAKEMYGVSVAAELEKLGASTSSANVSYKDQSFTLDHGAVVIAAITSCTNTSNPSVMLAAGMLARNAVQKGLQVKPWVKTSLAPGSKVVTDYFAQAGVQEFLDTAGFPVGRLRLHDVHRQLRPSSGAHRESDRGAQARHGRRALRQPELRGSREPAHAVQLSRITATGGRVRVGGPHGHRPHARAHRRRDERTGLPQRHLAQRGGRPRARCCGA